jgi:hypothetical protein
MSGYYPDPVPEYLRRDRDARAKQTRTRTQYCYAVVGPRLQATLGSKNLRPNTKLFIDGDYTFPVQDTQQVGYLDINNVTFNSTNRPTIGSAAGAGRVPQGGSSRRRDVPIKQASTSSSRFGQAAPTTPQGPSSSTSMTTPGSRTFAASTSRGTPASSITVGGSFDLTTDNFTDIDDFVNLGDSQKKRAYEEPPTVESSKRQLPRDTCS